MKIIKKVKCLHCSSEIVNNECCKCGAIKMLDEKVIYGIEHKDYIDVSAKLLNETV